MLEAREVEELEERGGKEEGKMRGGKALRVHQYLLSYL